LNFCIFRHEELRIPKSSRFNSARTTPIGTGGGRTPIGATTPIKPRTYQPVISLVQKPVVAKNGEAEENPVVGNVSQEEMDDLWEGYEMEVDGEEGLGEAWWAGEF